MFFRGKARPGRESLCTDVLLSSTLAQMHYCGCSRMCGSVSFFALARVYAHELGNVLGRVRV